MTDLKHNADNFCLKCNGTKFKPSEFPVLSGYFLKCDCQLSAPIPAPEQGGPYKIEMNHPTASGRLVIGPGYSQVFGSAESARWDCETRNLCFTQGLAAQASRVTALE